MSSGEEGFEHKTRKLIYNYISAHPGSSFGVIRNFLDLNDSTLKYHLIYLERANQISSKREGKRRCYFCKGSQFVSQVGPIVFDPNLLTENQRRILTGIQAKPGITKKELIEQTKLNRKTVSYNLDKLLEQKKIWKVNHSGEVGYEYITKEKLYYEMYNRLLLKLLSDEIDEATFLRIKKKLESLDVEDIRI